MATKGSKIHKVTRAVTLAKTFDDDGAPVEVLVRRLRPATITYIYEGVPGVAVPTTDLEREAALALSRAEQAAMEERYVTIADRIICAASVEPRFYVDAPPDGAVEDLWADVGAIHEDYKTLLLGTVMEMSGLVATDPVEKEEGESLATFPDDAAGRGDG